ncbi:hypothetical protein GCM10010344_24140 [Streptomyces bluensis]|nr:hypothetical protein GCM10010344_24140 [Streptomyces bluensis]
MDICAGGVADGDASGEGLSAASAAGAAVSDMDIDRGNDRDNDTAEATSRDRLVVFKEAGTTEKVHGSDRQVLPFPPPGRRSGARKGNTGPMKLSRPLSWFLLAFGVWSWVIWITFVKNLWNDGSGLAFDDAGDPTAYFWVHLTLAVVSFVLGTAIGVIGLRGLRALRPTS